MNKTFKTYLFLLGVIMIILSLLELNKKPIIDWSLNYDINKKSPFGLYIFNQEANKLFDNQLVRVLEEPYLYLERDTLRKPQNYLCIEKELTQEAQNYLLKEVKKGSSVLYIDKDMRYFSDTLNFKTDIYYHLGDSIRFHFKDKRLKKRSIAVGKNFNHTVFKKIDPKTTEILGYKKDLSGDRIVFYIRVNYGKGNFYFLSEPLLLTNFYLKEHENQKGIEGLFSYLPKRKTIWFQLEETLDNSEMRFILKNSALRSMWQLVVVLLVLFVIFTAKRKQRIVPIIVPKSNKSVEFIKNIGNLYLQEGTVQDMAEKKVQYFLTKLRNDLYLNTDKLDKEFAQKLHQKTGKPIEDIEKALMMINNVLHPKKQFTETELIELNNSLDKIYI